MAKPVTLTRAHFEMIAGLFSEIKPAPGMSADYKAQWEYSVERFAAEFNATNASFDVARFEKACGLESAK